MIAKTAEPGSGGEGAWSSAVSRWTRTNVRSLGLLAWATVLMALTGVVHAFVVPVAADSPDGPLGAPLAATELVQLVLALGFAWAAVGLSRNTPPPGIACSAGARDLVLYAAVAWLGLGVARGLHGWLAIDDTTSLRELVAIIAGNAAVGLLWHAALIGVLWLLLSLVRYRDGSAPRGWIVAALALQGAAALAGLAHDVLRLVRYARIQAILDAPDATGPWPSREPVATAGLVAGVIGLVTLIVTVVAILGARRRLRRELTRAGSTAESAG